MGPRRCRASPRGNTRSRSRRRAASSSSSKSSSDELAAVAGGELPDRQLGLGRPSQLSHPEQGATPAEREDRPVLADEPVGRAGSGRSGRSRTSCCARARRRSVRAARPRSSSAAATKRIITSGPQIIAVVRAPSKPARRNQLGDHADAAVPFAGRSVDRDLDLESRPRARLELAEEEHLVRRTGAVEQRHRP